MSAVCDLFFELSHENRMKILMLLKNLDEENLTKISKEMEVSTQEVYRHISRLVESRLLIKTLAGNYELSFYGKLVLEMVPGYKFLAEHSDYFQNHDTTMLPQDFILSLSKLNDSIYFEHVLLTLNKINSVIENADEYLWAITDRLSMNQVDIIVKSLKKDVTHKIIEPVNWEPSPDLDNYYTEGVIQQLRSSEINGKLQIRKIPKIPIFLFLNNKCETVFGFPGEHGKIDFIGFYSENRKASEWIKDLFIHFFDLSEPADAYIPEPG